MYNVEPRFGKKFSFLSSMNLNPIVQAIFRASCVLACLSAYAMPAYGQQPIRVSAESSPRVFLLDGNLQEQPLLLYRTICQNQHEVSGEVRD